MGGFTDSMIVTYTIASALIVSLISVLVALPLFIIREIPHRILLTLLSISVGTLLGSAFIVFLPEAISEGYTLEVAFYILAGFFAFFIIEKLVHNHHSKNHKTDHHHAYQLAPLNLIGEGIHNFVDGLVIAGSYSISVPLGIAATVSVIIHEVPQEIADFGILLYAGFSKKKALIYNFISALAGIAGALIGLIAQRTIDNFSEFIVPFTVGVFLYMGASNLIPELHKEHTMKDIVLQIVAALCGVLLMVAIMHLSPGHVH